MLGASASTVEFQSTHPRGVRRLRFMPTAFPIMFQSTHPRGVRLLVRNPCNHRGGVSIHAPTWGATRYWTKQKPLAICFNPRTHVGCDVKLVAYRNCISVSIHAPTWGATARAPHRKQAGVVSIHAPTWGATSANSQR